MIEKTLRKRMIPIHLCSTVQRFKHVLEKDFKTCKQDASVKRSFGGHKQLNVNRFIHCAIDTDHKKHVYIRRVKFLNQHFHITLEMVCNICMYHVRATLTAQ